MQKQTESILIPHVHETSHKTLSSFGYMIAGGFAGMVEHVAIYPIDTVKTHMQAFSDPLFKSISKTVKHIIKSDGVIGLYRGVTAVVADAIPSHAAYFAAYEASKKFLQKGSDHVTPFVSGVSGIVATFAHDAISTPIDVIKQRMQIAKVPYKSIVHCAKDILKTEGVRAYYLSFPTTLLMNIPYFCVQFMTYEATKRPLTKQGLNDHSVSLVAGTIAGIAGAACSNPFDVVKTHLQTKSSQYNGLIHATKVIYSQFGVKGFFAGISARMAFFGLSSGALWLSYEWMKKILREMQGEE